MTTARHFMSLIQSHCVGDNRRFLNVAMLAADEARKSGNAKVADDIANMVKQAEAKREREALSRARTPQEMQGLVAERHPSRRRADMIISGAAAVRIDRVLRENLNADLLRARNLSPTRKLLLSGPPGTGKGMTAGVLAAELDLPLFVVRLEGLISSHLGETASKLKLVFDMAAARRGVYFFDEFDALGAERGRGDDIGEARRIVNSVLMMLEEDDSASLILAATNHSDILDKALMRRFDAVICYANPTPDDAVALLARTVAEFEWAGEPDWPAIAPSAAWLSHADLVYGATNACRDCVLDNGGFMTASILRAALDERRAGQN